MVVFRLSLFVVLLVSNVFACYPHENLMVCWDMQEGKDARVKDSSGKGQDGSMNGAVGWAPGTSPRAVTQFATYSGSATFANTGPTMITFPGTADVDVRNVDTSKFAFTGVTPMIIVITIQPTVLEAVDNRELVACDASGVGGWQFWHDNTGLFGIRVITVAAPTFTYRLADTNPHRAMLARNSLGHTYLFIDGEFKEVMSVASSVLAVTAALKVGGDDGGLGIFTGKANRLAIYNFDFLDAYIKAFAKNEYRYWQGMNEPMDQEEK